MDKVIKIEEFESDMAGEEFEFKDVTQLTGEFNVKTEHDTLHTELDIKNNIDTSLHIHIGRMKNEQIIIEKQDDNTDSPPVSNKWVKIEKVEPEMINSEHNIGKWNEAVSCVVNIVDKTDTDVNLLHTESDIKNESDPSLSAIPCTSATNEIPRTKHQLVADSKIGGGSFTCYHCEYTVNSKHHLIRHIKVHENRENTYSCCYCDFRTNFEKLFFTHMRTHPSNCTQFEVVYIREENVTRENLNRTVRCMYCSKAFTRKQSLNDHITKKHPDFIASVSSKIHECTRCTHKTTDSTRLKEHIMRKHPEIAGNRIFNRCMYCDKTFARKGSLGDHILKKHPDFIASVSCKIHECAKCTFKTTMVDSFNRHNMLKHPVAAANNELSACAHCKAAFRSKQALDDHILKKHPKFIESVSSKIHGCTKCIFKTTMISHLNKHMLKHLDAAAYRKLDVCIHCSSEFKSKQALDDHILKEHPSFIESVSRFIHKCAKCSFKTTISNSLRAHLLEHPETAADYLKCLHCNAPFKSKAALDDHIIRSHPVFIPSITTKIHDCTKCTFKTTIKSHLDRHISRHHETATNNKCSTCAHCNTPFKSNKALDDHIIRKHPDFIASISSKIHECTKCTFKTTIGTHLDRHISRHHETTVHRRRKPLAHSASAS